jgi:uncharacterized protein
MNMKKKHTNALIHETSPYLLQHAHNPVNWHPWGNEALEKAKSEDKLLLVSIGYAACHWCHVMEYECFEDEQVAQVMNEHYVCIKVDREERPDVDHYFMTAIHLTGGQGGWPLNCVALPDGKPLWGGTYFPKENWMQALLEINRLYREQRNHTIGHATNLANGIQQASLSVQQGSETPATPQLIDNAVNKWKYHFDHKNGGRNGKPKFPMPVNLEFLLQYAHVRNDAETLQYLELTLEKMALGGIYDQIGGGFARYSVDEIWKVPHFEKMLYDNGQLLSVYSQAFQKSGNPLYKQVVHETVDWLEREMMHPSGAFFSSLDADSEGVEGKFYTWTLTELKTLLKEEFALFAEYYNVNNTGYWEDGSYILLRTQSDDEFASKYGLQTDKMKTRVIGWKEKLLNHRKTRIRPGLDDKTLTSWSALVTKGLCDAAKAFGEERFYDIALKNGKFITEQLYTQNGGLWHTWKNGKASIVGFLEDYALTIQAFISLWEISGDEAWLKKARSLTSYTLKNFFEEEQNLFLFNEKNSSDIISNHFQIEDNVVAASNSVMAINLLKLSRLFSDTEYERIALRIARNMVSNFAAYPYAHANWGRLFLLLTEGTREVALVGENSLTLMGDLQKSFSPCTVWAAAPQESTLPLFQNRYVKGKTLIYVCRNGSCRLPVESVEEAKKLLD